MNAVLTYKEGIAIQVTTGQLVWEGHFAVLTEYDDVYEMIKSWEIFGVNRLDSSDIARMQSWATANHHVSLWTLT